MKRQAEKTGQAQSAGVPGEWLYFAPEGVDVGAVAGALEGKYETELWEEAGVLEIVLEEKNSLDVEQATIHPKDVPTAEYAHAHGCDTVFLVTFRAEEFARVKPVMLEIIAACGGLFCGDTADFSPEVQ